MGTTLGGREELGGCKLELGSCRWRQNPPPPPGACGAGLHNGTMHGEAQDNGTVVEGLWHGETTGIVARRRLGGENRFLSEFSSSPVITRAEGGGLESLK